ncbi:hypothetical protein DPSP01_011421 [Paraphaeosphaeria sporulosa]
MSSITIQEKRHVSGKQSRIGCMSLGHYLHFAGRLNCRRKDGFQIEYLNTLYMWTHLVYFQAHLHLTMHIFSYMSSTPIVNLPPMRLHESRATPKSTHTMST